MHILNKNRITSRLQERGFSSLTELSKKMGVHRNSLHHYLSGKPIFPKSIEQLLTILDLSAEEAFEVKNKVSPTLPIADIVDKLHAQFPHFTFVLFGSRTRGVHHQFSDWDIGVYSSTPPTHKEFQKFLIEARDLVEKSLFVIDFVNLNRADKEFLKEISRSWQFLTGKQSDWGKLREAV